MITSRYQVRPLAFPVDGYNYYVLEWKSTDGENYMNCGQSKYFVTLEEAEAYKTEMEGAQK